MLNYLSQKVKIIERLRRYGRLLAHRNLCDNQGTHMEQVSGLAPEDE